MVQLFRVRGALSHDKLQSATQEEVKMAEQDLTEADRLVAKNSVEELAGLQGEFELIKDIMRSIGAAPLAIYIYIYISYYL